MSTKKLTALRDQIAALVDERDDLKDAPLARDEGAARIDAVLNAIQTDPIHGSSPAGLSNGSFDITEALKMLDKPASLIELLREPLKAYLLGVFDAAAGETTGLPAVERRAKLKELNAEIFGLERAEEELIEALEEQGHDIPRRPAADPRAALSLGAPSEAA